MKQGNTMSTETEIKVWSPFQEAVFAFTQQGTGNAVVEAVAGSGKTTTIVEAVSRMRGQVFLGAYNSKMGKELAERTRDMRNVTASTFHSIGFKDLYKGLEWNRVFLLGRDEFMPGRMARSE